MVDQHLGPAEQVIEAEGRPAVVERVGRAVQDAHHERSVGEVAHRVAEAIPPRGDWAPTGRARRHVARLGRATRQRARTRHHAHPHATGPTFSGTVAAHAGDRDDAGGEDVRTRTMRLHPPTRHVAAAPSAAATYHSTAQAGERERADERGRGQVRGNGDERHVAEHRDQDRRHRKLCADRDAQALAQPARPGQPRGDRTARGRRCPRSPRTTARNPPSESRTDPRAARRWPRAPAPAARLSDDPGSGRPSSTPPSHKPAAPTAPTGSSCRTPRAP